MEKTKKSLIWGSIIIVIKVIKATIRIFSRRRETISKVGLILRLGSPLASKEAVTLINQHLPDMVTIVN